MALLALPALRSRLSYNITVRPTYLYVKTHNVTKMRYFGKTVNDPYVYRGSGLAWLQHLTEHGNHVSTEILGEFIDETELREVAEAFSVENDIVKSPEWANLIYEVGHVRSSSRSRPTRQKAFTARVDASMAEVFEGLCSMLGITVAEGFRRAIDMWLELPTQVREDSAEDFRRGLTS